MSLSLALNNALSGLIAEQRALAITSQNITNAHTEGYTKRVVSFAAQYIDNYETGVQVDNVVRAIDYYMQKALQQKTSDVELASTKVDFLDQLQLVFGGPGSGNSIDVYAQNFFSAMQDLSGSPQSASLKYLAVNAGVELANSISNTALGIENLRFQADKEISDTVDAINKELMTLYEINVAINTAYGSGNDSNGLADERDAALTRLSGYLDINYYLEKNGSVQVYTGNGLALVGFEPYQLDYQPLGGVDVLLEDGPIDAIKVFPVDYNGNQVGTAYTLATDNGDGSVTSYLKSGQLQGLLEIRDFDFANTLAQLDELAANLRDTVNAIHNDGAGFPASDTLQGTRELTLGALRTFDGSVRIAVVDETGNSLPKLYNSENGGFRPLTLDFSTLDSGGGNGTVSVESILKEINYHFGLPTSQTSLSNMNDIRLVSLEPTVAGGTFEFDFELENVSVRDSDFTILGIRVEDDTTAVIDTISPTNLLGASPIATTLDSNTITVTSAGHSFSIGDRVTLANVAGTVGGISSVDLNGSHVITAVTANSYSFDVKPAASATATGGGAAVEEVETYTSVLAGEKIRSKPDGTFTVDFSGSAASSYYTINIDVMVDDDTNEANSGVQTSTISFRVPNNTTSNMNDRFFANAVTAGTATISAPDIYKSYLKAELINNAGIPISSGSNEAGYLRLTASDASYMIAIDELDSEDLGDPSQPGDETNRGFSHFFELNNFFVRNPDALSDQDANNSAINLQVRQDIIDNPSLLATGQLVQSTQPSAFQGLARYDYELSIGNNEIAKRLAAVGISHINFKSAGQLPALTMSLTDYSGEVIGYAAALKNAADDTLSKEEFLRQGFADRVDAMSGVNIDEELANTIIYQNAYAAAARVITTTNEMFDILLSAF